MERRLHNLNPTVHSDMKAHTRFSATHLNPVFTIFFKRIARISSRASGRYLQVCIRADTAKICDSQDIGKR